MICLDACILGHVLVPENSRVAAAEKAASRKLIDRIIKGQTKGCSPTIMISETKWLISRYVNATMPAEVLSRADEVEELLPQVLGTYFRFIDVDFAIAALAADFRVEHYSKKNAFSYNDGLYLATASITGCEALVTTDKHLLATQEVPVFTPSALLAKNKIPADKTAI
ncbi:MAG: type II toxin-antitoxin system VapC family toxin [Actinomycetota bacterium]